MSKTTLKIFLSSVFFTLVIQTSFAQQASLSTVQVEAQPLELNKPIERELKASETQAYKIALEKGQFLSAVVNQRGIDVVVTVFAPDKSKIAEIDSPNGTHGDEPIALEAKVAGTYRVEISSFEKNVQPGRYVIRINELAKDYAAWIAEKLRKQQAAIAWLKENAIPIKTVEAGNSFQDLQPLKRVFKDVRFVGLGEETHGTREFFQFKHRMLEFLVREMGFRVFAIEASYSACQDINDYVMGKTDDGAKALHSQGFWTWDTEEVRAMLDWMREYNRSVAENKRVKFFGFDIQVNQPGKDKLLPYLRRVAPERAAETETFFSVNFEKEFNSILTAPKDANYETKYKETAAKLDDLKNKYNDLLVFLELNQTRLARQTSQAETEQMSEYARVLAQDIDGSSKFFVGYGKANDLGSDLRDYYMADNFRRLVEREPAGTRFVIWAHNLHISIDSGEDD
ncbi:MAG: erythromycin esterase family protein, partial [Pyrinomonadaceae bacterium]